MQAERGPETALALARAALASLPAGLLTDLDGTIAPIVADPSEAKALPGAVEGLRALSARLAVVAVITGRAAAQARLMLGEAGDRVAVVGNHGLEWLEPGSVAPHADESLEPLRATVSEVAARVPQLAGVSVESKGLSATIHYRRASDPHTARAAILAALGDVRELGLDVREGRMSVEVRPAGRGDKGSAVRAIADRFRLQGLVVAGDDATDVDMFHAAQDLRSRGARVALIGVAGGREVPSEVSATVDVLLPDPQAFGDLLQRLAEDAGP